MRVRGRPDAAVLDRLKAGVTLEDGPARFDRIEPAAPHDSRAAALRPQARSLATAASAHTWFRVVLHEGRNREVRRLWQAVGFEVSRLSRLRYGPIALPPDLRPGAVAAAGRGRGSSSGPAAGYLSSRKAADGPICALTGHGAEIRIRGSFFAEGYPSGQREQTVNLPAYAFVGSNPTPSTMEGAVGFSKAVSKARQFSQRVGLGHSGVTGGCSSMVEPQPSKLMTWVRFPLPAPAVQLRRREHLEFVAAASPVYSAMLRARTPT